MQHAQSTAVFGNAQGGKLKYCGEPKGKQKNMTFLIRIFFILAIVATTACDSDNKQSMIVSQISSDTLLQKISVNENDNSATAYKYKRQLCQMMKLDQIENGFDSIIMRLWFGYRNTDSVEILTIKNNRLTWEAEWIKAIPQYGSADSLMGVEFKKQKLISKKNWNDFIGLLFDTGIMTLPCYNNMQANNVMESGGISIELATSKYYSFCLYPPPSALSKEYSNIKDVLENGLRLINDEFSIQGWKMVNAVPSERSENVKLTEIETED